MNRSHLLALILAGAGAFTICGAVFDWEWFMNNRKARFWVLLFGRKRARIFYGVLGTAIATVGGLMLAGVIGSPK